MGITTIEDELERNASRLEYEVRDLKRQARAVEAGFFEYYKILWNIVREDGFREMLRFDRDFFLCRYLGLRIE